MCPPVALRHPDDLLPVADVEAELAARVAESAVGPAIVDEGFRALGEDRSRAAARRIGFDHAVELVSALVVFEGERTAILAPHDARKLVRIREERVVDRDLRLRGDV